MTDVGTLNIGQVVRRSEIWFAASRGLAEAEIARWQRINRKCFLDLCVECLEATKGRRAADTSGPGIPSARTETSWMA